MKRLLTSLRSAAVLAVSALLLSQCGTAGPGSRIASATVDPRELATDSRAALDALYRRYPKTRQLGAKAKGILVFPSVTKGGLMVGGLGGTGALIEPDGKVREFYQTSGLSYGLQAGVQKYSYALFLMDNQARSYLRQSGGWQVGSAPGLVVVDESISGSMSVGSINRGTYAVLYHARGLMGGLGLQGSQISRFVPSQR